jgi:hypothetical protein
MAWRGRALGLPPPERGVITLTKHDATPSSSAHPATESGAGAPANEPTTEMIGAGLRVFQANFPDELERDGDKQVGLVLSQIFMVMDRARLAAELRADLARR